MAEEEKVEAVEAVEEEEKIGEDEEAEEVEEESKPGFFSNIKARFGKILIYLIGAIMVILLTIGTSIWVGFKMGKKRELREVGGKMVIPPPEPYANMDLGMFTINIPGDDAEPHFIRVKIHLGYKERDMTLQAELGKRRIQIKDIINMIVSRKSMKELEKPEGKENLKIEIREQINQILQSGKIKAVYFEDLTVM